MKNTLLFLIVIFLCACENTSEPIDSSKVEKVETEPFIDNLEVKDEEEKEAYPSAYCLDSTWEVFSDIQEGFFMSYTIRYSSKKDTTVSVDESSPTGGVDYPEPYYQDSLTYVVPNVGGCNRGHYTLYIYKDGSHQFVEQINVINSLKKEVEESKNHSEIQRNDSIYNKYWASIYNTVFNSSHQVFLDERTSSIKFSNAFSFYIDSKIDSFQFKDEQLLNLNFVYSEYNGLYWREGKNIQKGKIRGALQDDNTWLLDIDVFIELVNEINEEKVIRNLKLTLKYIKE